MISFLKVPEDKLKTQKRMQQVLFIEKINRLITYNKKQVEMK